MIGEKSSFDLDIDGPARYQFDIEGYALKRDVSKKFNITENKINEIIGVFNGEAGYSNHTGVITKELKEILFL
jgi:hypothetical protein